MAAELIGLIDDAFRDDASLGLGVKEAVDSTPHYAPLFKNISQYIITGRQGNSGHASTLQQDAGPPLKKRRLEEHTSGQVPDAGPRRLLLEARDISFSLPQRKKFHLGLVQYGNTINSTGTFAIQGRNAATNQVDFEISLSNFAYALRLPVPEKNQKQYNFCLLPPADKATVVEPVIWTINHGPLKSCKVDDADLAKIAPGPENILEDALTFVLGKSGTTLTFPDEKEFASAVRESHRKNDIAYHVKAHRGSKEGYLFFLANGIFFGFKKPLSFFPFNEIESISYTSVLQRTFNLNITVQVSADADAQDIEFSMLDQQDFAGIDEYIKAHSLQDASLAEARRAKKIGKAVKSEAGAAEQGDDDGRTELEKAQQEIEDEEDEMEEDYDPDADDSDDGSGSSSDDDDQNYTRGKGRNLVAEELGSEAEDVSASEDDEKEDEDDEGEDEVEDDICEPEVVPKHVQMPSRPTPVESHKSVPVQQPDYDDDDQL